MSDDLRGLRRILNEAIDSILDICSRRNEDFPSLNAPCQLSEFSPQGIRNDPDVARAIKLGVAAAHQLAATLQSPLQTVIGLGPQATLSANVAAVERTHVAEIMRQYGNGGMRVSDIVRHNGTSADKLERILRHLATHHVFQEVSPGVFSHNLLSSLLDTGKDFEVIKKDPDAKFDNTNGLAAFASLLTHEQMRTYAYIPDLMTDLAIVDSQELADASVQKAYNTKLGYWQFLDLPENAFTNRRFNIGMQGVSSMQPPGTILTMYDWRSVPEHGLVNVVDIGSGLGHVSIEIASVRPDLDFVLEDRAIVLQDAKEYMAKHAPAVLTKTHFIPADYLQPQPSLPTAPDIFVLRNILHDISDKYAMILLKHLLNASKPSTQLVIIDYVVEHPCLTSHNSESQDAIPGAAAPSAPPPLLPNYGVAAALPYQMDMIVMSHFNSKERTIENWTSILGASGWKLARVNRDPTNGTDWPLLVAQIA